VAHTKNTTLLLAIQAANFGPSDVIFCLNVTTTTITTTTTAVMMMVIQVNTPFIEIAHQGINHTEGGWPKDVSAADPEQTTRHRRKLEKDEQYAIQMLSLAEVRFSFDVTRLSSPFLARPTFCRLFRVFRSN